jgi:hypothetical protein
MGDDTDAFLNALADVPEDLSALEAELMADQTETTADEHVRVKLCPSIHCEMQNRCCFPDKCVVKLRMSAALAEAMKEVPHD